LFFIDLQKMILNSTNIEDLVLRNPGLLNKLSHYRDQIEQWKLGQLVPALRPMGQKAKLDLLNKLTEGDLEIIRNYLKVNSLVLESLDYATVKNHTTTVFDAEELLNGANVMLNDFCVARDGDQLYICTWR
jgi:hypothetical protein